VVPEARWDWREAGICFMVRMLGLSRSELAGMNTRGK
jgi:hypothetical protein